MDYIIPEKVPAELVCASSNPDAFAGLDSDKIAETQKARSAAFRPMMDATQANKLSWLVAGSCLVKNGQLKYFQN